MGHVTDVLSCASRTSPSDSTPPTAPPADDKEAEGSEPSSAGSSPTQPVEGGTLSVAFVGRHPDLPLQAGQLPSNTSGQRFAPPGVGAAPLFVSQEQSVKPEIAKVEEQVRSSVPRSSLALSSVSVKSRIAAFEKKSPTASTFGLSPPRLGNVDPASHDSPVLPEEKEEKRALARTTPDLDFSETNFPTLPPAYRAPWNRRGFAPAAPWEVDTFPVFRKDLSLPLTPRLRPTRHPLQSPPLPPKTDLFGAPESVLESSALSEQPKTPRLGKASLVLPIRSKGAENDRPFPETSTSQTGLQIPSFDWPLLSESPLERLLERVKYHELSGPSPRPGHARARHNRPKPQSRLSHVVRADSPPEESPGLLQTQPTHFDDSDARSSLPQGHSDIERSSSTRRNRAATLRSLEGLETVEEQATPFTTESVEEGSGPSTEVFSQTALVPKPLRPCRTTAVGLEAKGSGEKGSTLVRADKEHPNLSDFSFSFDTATEKVSSTTEEVKPKPKPTLLPSLLPRPGYSTPPNSPQLSEAEGQSYDLSVSTVAEASVFDFDRPSRRRAVAPPSPFGHPFSPSSESPTPRQKKVGGPFLSRLVSEEAEEITPPITRSLIRHHLRPSDSSSESDSDTMDRLRPESALAVSHHRREAMRLAKAQEAGVVEKCRRSGAAIPGYTFDELIGKGSFGRVYKW